MESIVEEPGGEQDRGEAELVSNVINILRPSPKTGGADTLRNLKILYSPPLLRKRKMEDVMWDVDDQMMMEGHDEFLGKRLKTGTASNVEDSLVSRDQADVRMVGTRSLEDDCELDEDDILKKEDDLFEEEDDSWEKLADDTLSLMEQRCLKSVVTSPSTPDQPDKDVVVE